MYIYIYTYRAFIHLGMLRLHFTRYVAQMKDKSNLDFTRATLQQIAAFIGTRVLLKLHYIIEDAECFELFSGSANMARAFSDVVGKDSWESCSDHETSKPFCVFT